MDLTVKEGNALFFRYLRPSARARDSSGYEYVTGISNLGGVVFAINLDYTNRTISIGVSVCSNKENFSKDKGRLISLYRLENDPYVFDLDYFYIDKCRSTLERLYNLLQQIPSIPGNKGMRAILLERCEVV